MSFLVLGWGLAVGVFLSGRGGTLFALTLIQAFLLTLVRFLPWYSREDRGWGIEEHFQKIVVIVGYLLTLNAALAWVWPGFWPFLLLTNLVFLFLNAVNTVLLTFHFRDKDNTPPAFLSRS
ncbi:MAG: hypothetical protein Q7T11_08135 [Deltaproteobacteria bacterium]|nr:hypothetical protein [Deltaproteobacteria bacterium]